MNAELGLVRSALKWGALATLPAAGVAYLLRGSDGAISVVLAAALVLGNAAAAAGLSALAGRISTVSAAMVALPSFTIRMAAIFGALALLKGRSFVDDPTFALTFGLAVTAVLVLEARAWKRTPWLATLEERR